MIQGKEIAIPSFGGAVNDKGTLVGKRLFIALKAGLTAEDIKELSFKEMKVAAVAAGNATDAQITQWGKDYVIERDSFYSQGGLVNGMLASDPSYRKTLKINRNKDGAVIGATTVYRKERSPSMSLKAENESLKAQVAKLTALLPA
jgi:hypothetical protein